MTKEEKKLLLELIGNEQIHMLIKDNSKYDSDKYKKLEELKIKIKDMKESKVCIEEINTSRISTYELYSSCPKPKKERDDVDYDIGCVDAEGDE